VVEEDIVAVVGYWNLGELRCIYAELKFCIRILFKKFLRVGHG
jgi:hypothetical protein